MCYNMKEGCSMGCLNNHNIYIVLTYTGTVLSRFIKLYTGDEFSHVSLSLDKELKEMYSFGRLKPYNPFIGGFIHEKIDDGTFKRFPNTKAAIYSLKVTSYQYAKIKEIINEMKIKKTNYKFNIIGLFATGLNIRYQKDNYFYCAEFVKHLIDEANIDINLPNIVKPNDFKKVKQLKLKYYGNLNKY